MSSLLDPNNPIVLFGDIGPETVKFSQIYNPENDQYILSSDVSVYDLTKPYYTRTYANKVVTFTKVNTVTAADNPMANGWYEVNIGHEDQTGKYVPAESSIVVVDKLNVDYPVRTVLIVESVDPVTLRSTLVPIHTGAEDDETARILDYGNDRFMLYFEQNGDKTYLVPDRKLMLYGKHCYMYRLTYNGVVISTPVDGRTRELVPYVSATAQRTKISAANYGEYTGCKFDVLRGHRFVRLTVPEKTVPPAKIPALLPWYKTGNTYYLYSPATYLKATGLYQTGVDYYLKSVDTYTKIDTTSLIGTPISGDVYLRIPEGYTQLTEWDGVSAREASKTYFVKSERLGKIYVGTAAETEVDDMRLYQTADQAFDEGISGWLNRDSSKSTVFYPENCLLRAGTICPIAGDTVTLDVYEFEEEFNQGRKILNVRLVAAQGQSIDPTEACAPKVHKFDVRYDDRIVSDPNPNYIYVKVGDDVTHLVENLDPYVMFDDGTEKVVKVDGKKCFCYGMGSVSTANVGAEFKLLFKYYPNGVNQSTSSNDARQFMSVTKILKVLNGADRTISKISIFPVWNHLTSKYLFKYAIYRSGPTYPQPEIVDELGTAVVFADGSVERTADGKVVQLTDCTYLDGSGAIRPTSAPGDTMGYVICGKIAVYASASAHVNSVYAQDVSLRLQNWEHSSLPLKWLIGESNTGYDASLLKYGNATDIRPYIVYDPSADVTPFSIGSDFLTTDAFLRAFYKNGLCPISNDSSIDNTSTKTGVTPTWFIVRAFQHNDFYETLNSTTALEDVEYYNAEGTRIVVEVGDDVTGLDVKVQSGLDYYVKEGDTWVLATDVPEVGTKLTSAQRAKYAVYHNREIVSEKIPIGDDDNPTWASTHFQMKGANPTVIRDGSSETFSTGASIPTIIGSSLATPLMGSVIVEFMQGDRDDPSSFKHLYGVPVEVRFGYKLSEDTEYDATKTYYTYGCKASEFETTAAANYQNKFFVDDKKAAGEPIESAVQARYEKIS